MSRFDLHVHSTASDGALSPTEVVRAAGWGELDAIALTDHDTVSGVQEATEAGANLGIRVIPGIELSSTHEGREIHILGYFIDPASPRLLAQTERALHRREARVGEMIARLAEGGVHVDIEAVRQQAGPEGSVLGRPHLAAAMVELGIVETQNQAFDEWIGDGHPAFVPTDLGSPLDAVRTIQEAGGISVWAHPPGDLVEELLPGFVEGGLQGIEVYRSRHQARATRYFSGLAEEWKLLASGGSDWHSEDRNGKLGTFSVGREEIGPLLDAGGW